MKNQGRNKKGSKDNPSLRSPLMAEKEKMTAANEIRDMAS
jgi:hypothetical protein